MNFAEKFKIALVLSLITAILVSTYIAFGAGGDSTDPLISKSYLEDVLTPKILAEVDKKIAASATTGTPSTGEAVGFVAVEVKAGQTLLGKAGTELILRIGTASAVCPGDNGMVDTTAGLDLTHGKNVEKNHVYIVPREDGRGFKMADNGFVMIKGGYTVS